MLPTLNGRIQTRIFVLVVIGGLWTLVITPLIGATFDTTYRVLLAVLVLGVLWEFVYHFLQQFRWEKDWPTFFGLVTAINEGVLIWVLIQLDVVPGLDASLPVTAFLVQFLTTWVIVWLVVNGPMRVPFIHWRFRGGRLV